MLLFKISKYHQILHRWQHQMIAAPPPPQRWIHLSPSMRGIGTARAC